MTWLAIKLLLGGWLGRLRAALGAFGAWAARNPASAVCLALGALCALFWHEWAVKDRDVARLTAANATLRHDLDIDATSIKDLQAAIAKQNLATMALGKDSAAAQAQGAKADQAALDRSARRDALSAGITVPTTPPAQCDNRTPADVMAAKGDL